MSLRRLAANNAASPRVKKTNDPASPSPSYTPLSTFRTPSIPRTRLSYPISPETSPSLSAATPFDWEAARLRKTPPYGSPLQDAKARIGKSDVKSQSKTKRFVRKKPLRERIVSLPSDILFELTMFPENLPLPSPKISAWLIGGSMHIIHFFVRVHQNSQVPDDEVSWEDLYSESRGSGWFDWTTPIAFLLIVISVFNTIQFFSRIKLYHLHHRTDPVASPNAAFVNTEFDFSPLEPPPLYSRIMAWFMQQLSASWRFLWALEPPQLSNGGKTKRVQQLSIWNPGELEMHLFKLYSPVHALLWLAARRDNWILIIFIMIMTSGELQLLMTNYGTLIKDRNIISAEVMHEYDKKFVIPRINPVRKDASVMTHQSEMVDIWM